jgi:hypothetical protein
MKPLAYLLLLLVISAQVDDYWAAAPILPSTPPADDDEYLPSQPRPQEQACSACRTPEFVGLKPQPADFPFLETGVPSQWNLITPFAPPPLYVFMSLVI